MVLNGHEGSWNGNIEQSFLQDALAANRERLEIELEGKNRVLEAERLEEEQELVVRMKGERKRCLDYEQSKLQEKIEWQKFVSCTSRPNVMCGAWRSTLIAADTKRVQLRFENEITTYVSMVRPKLSDEQTETWQDHDVMLDFAVWCFGDAWNRAIPMVNGEVVPGEERSDRKSMETAIEKCKAAEEVVKDSAVFSQLDLS